MIIGKRVYTIFEVAHRCIFSSSVVTDVNFLPVEFIIPRSCTMGQSSLYRIGLITAFSGLAHGSASRFDVDPKEPARIGPEDFMFPMDPYDDVTSLIPDRGYLDPIIVDDWWMWENDDAREDGNTWDETAGRLNQILDELRVVETGTTDPAMHIVGDSESRSDGWEISSDKEVSRPGWIERDATGKEYVIGYIVARNKEGNGVYMCEAKQQSSTHSVLRWLRNLTFSSSQVVPTNNEAPDDAMNGGSENFPLVIKYVNNCNPLYLDPAHPTDLLLNEYIILRAIKYLEIAPRPVSLSAALSPTRPQWRGDVRFHFSNEYQQDFDLEGYCVENGAKARALIMERTGVSVGFFQKTYINTSSPSLQYILFAIRVGLRTIELLEILHNSGFVHGDVHPGNVAFRDSSDYMEDVVNSSEMPDLMLIDFGRSRFFPIEIPFEHLPRHHMSTSTMNLARDLLSHWQLNGYKTGRRDDLYRAMELTASILTPHGEFRNYMRSNLRTIDHILGRKSYVQFFTAKCVIRENQQDRILTICDLYEGIIQAGPCKRALRYLDEALRTVRSIKPADRRPNYNKIKSLFQVAIEYLIYLHDDPTVIQEYEPPRITIKLDPRRGQNS